MKKYVWCKKCHRRIIEKEAVYKERAPIWYHDRRHKKWWFYTGYFCKKCATETSKDSKFIRVYLYLWLTCFIGSSFAFFIYRFVYEIIYQVKFKTELNWAIWISVCLVVISLVAILIYLLTPRQKSKKTLNDKN